MEINPAEDWHSLRENYAAMLDGELELLADNLDDLTETAKEVLRSEMRNRGLGDPRAARQSRQRPHAANADRWASTVDPDAGVGRAREFDQNEESDGPKEFTWKTLLCECESEQQALQLRETLKRAGIDS
jgi:hypothetical protein